MAKDEVTSVSDIAHDDQKLEEKASTSVGPFIACRMNYLLNAKAVWRGSRPGPEGDDWDRL